MDKSRADKRYSVETVRTDDGKRSAKAAPFFSHAQHICTCTHRSGPSSLAKFRPEIPYSDRPTISECLRMIWRYFPKDASIISPKDFAMAAKNLNPSLFAYQLLQNKKHRVCMTNILRVIVGGVSGGQGWDETTAKRSSTDAIK